MRIFVACLIVAALALGGCSSSGGGATVDGDKPLVGFVQFTTTSSLDDARDGFVAALKEGGYEDGKTIRLELQNANGDLGTLKLAFQKLKDEGVKLVGVAGTPAAQSAVKSFRDIPVVFSAVVDPVVIGAASAPGQGISGVTGVANPFPVAEGLKMVREFAPKAKTVGTLYDPSEPFFPAMDAEAKKTCAELGLTWVSVAVTSPTDVPTSVAALKAKGADVMLQLPSNTINAALEGEVKAAHRAGLPIFSLQPDQIGKGVVAAVGVDLEKAGFEAGKLAVRILKGEKPEALTIPNADSRERGLDANLATKLGLTVPAGFKAGKE